MLAISLYACLLARVRRNLKKSWTFLPGLWKGKGEAWRSLAPLLALRRS